MTTAALYHWRIKPGREDEFAAAWDEGTRRIHQTCGSYGAMLHRSDDGLFWSYASWPDEATRQTCFAENDWFSMDCFKTMQDCIEERFDEVVLDLVRDQLGPRTPKPLMPVLTTQRLVLRPLAMSDSDAIAPALMDKANMRYWSRDALPSLEAVRDYLSWNVRAPDAECYAICTPDSPGQALGWSILMQRRSGTAELGYILVPAAQGKGYAREAVAAVVKHGFETRSLRRIFADVDPENTSSCKLLADLGFQREGRLRAAWETHLGIRDSLIYSCIAE